MLLIRRDWRGCWCCFLPFEQLVYPGQERGVTHLAGGAEPSPKRPWRSVRRRRVARGGEKGTVATAEAPPPRTLTLFSSLRRPLSSWQRRRVVRCAGLALARLAFCLAGSTAGLGREAIPGCLGFRTKRRRCNRGATEEGGGAAGERHDQLRPQRASRAEEAPGPLYRGNSQ
jgi:hypothetical protein